MQKYFSVDECRLKLLLYFVTIVIAAKLAAHGEQDSRFPKIIGIQIVFVVIFLIIYP